MDFVGGLIGIGIVIAVGLYLVIFGEVDYSREKKPRAVSHRISKNR
jgi:hypothetical protein